jgi:hypothetical protein
MAVKPIPDEHHVVRHCKNSQYFMHNGKIRPHPESFHLKPATATMPEERVLSCVYYEWFDGTVDEKMRASCHFIRIEIKPKDALLRLNAGLIKQQGLTRSLKLRVTHEEEKECPPYAALRGIPKPPDSQLCLLLASLTVIDAIDFATLR